LRTPTTPAATRIRTATNAAQPGDREVGDLHLLPGDDATCTPQVHLAGTAYVDPGGTVHIARNESETEELVLIVTSLIPQGAMGRIDEADPGTCPL
jgi:hypothetical protein